MMEENDNQHHELFLPKNEPVVTLLEGNSELINLLE